MYQKKSGGYQKEGERPRFRPEKEPVDLLMEAAGLIAVVAMVVLTAVKFNGLPQQIPTHFNAMGQPDDYSGKWMIWLLPMITVILYTGMSILNRYPYIFNFPVNITPENASRMYRFACRCIRLLSLLLVLMFFYLTWQSILVANRHSSGLGAWFMLVTTGGIVLLTLYMIFGMYRLK